MQIAEVAMAEGGCLADQAGAWIGVGPGRGAALLFVLLGLANAAVAVLGAAYG